MSKKLPFDTLELATLLKEGGIEKHEVHAASLAAVITQNVYVKSEVDKMIETALAKIDASFNDFKNEFRLALERQDARHDKSMLELENRMEKRLNHNFYMTITILGALIAIFGAISTFSHYFIH